MDMNTGEVRELTDEERIKIRKRIARLSSVVDNQALAEHTAMKDVGLMAMTDDQIEATRWRSPRNARRYMLNQPCTCHSGKKAKKCCFGKDKP